MAQNIVIIDYQMGNLHSVYKKLKHLGANVIVSNKQVDILTADKLILPGVGHFKKAMENLKVLNLLDALNESVLVKNTPILGICLGMQLMAKFSTEGNAKGLGWIDASVERLKPTNTLKYKIPHIGWNQICIAKQSLLMHSIQDLSEFYFVHAYHVKTNSEADILNTTVYEQSFVSAIERDTIFGVQYHPEKSHDVGQQLLRNFLEL